MPALVQPDSTGSAHGAWAWARRLVPLCLLAALVTHGMASSASAVTTPVPKLVFGMGGEAGDAVQTPLVKEAPVRMLTSWYNGPGDLSWMEYWRNEAIPSWYAKGYALHLVTWSDSPEVNFPTKWGAACGRQYPLSDRFLGDMRRLAKLFAGRVNGPPLYVTLFSEFQTFPCIDNEWRPAGAAGIRTRNYYLALKARYLQTMRIFRANAPNARISLGWGGWQARWNDASVGGGRALIPHFAPEMQASDFQSFQAMAADSNVGDIRKMTKALHAYGKPVMLAHYFPTSPAAAAKDLPAIFNDAFLTEMRASGLFAIGFMDPRVFWNSQAHYTFIRNAVRRYAAA